MAATTVGRMVKESIVKELSTVLSDRPNFFITSINRMPAAEADSFRLKLHGSQAQFVVVQRKLGQRLVQPFNVPGLPELLEGSVGLVLPSDDVLPTAKLLVDFFKTREGQLTIRGAFIDGQLLTKARVEELASLPPKPMLLAYVVLTIESPLADLIFTVERLIGDLAWTLEQASAKPPTPAAAPAAPAAPEAPPTPDAPPDPPPQPSAEGEAAPAA